MGSSSRNFAAGLRCEASLSPRHRSSQPRPYRGAAYQIGANEIWRPRSGGHGGPAPQHLGQLRQSCCHGRAALGHEHLPAGSVSSDRQCTPARGRWGMTFGRCDAATDFLAKMPRILPNGGECPNWRGVGGAGGMSRRLTACFGRDASPAKHGEGAAHPDRNGTIRRERGLPNG